MSPKCLSAHLSVPVHILPSVFYSTFDVCDMGDHGRRKEKETNHIFKRSFLSIGEHSAVYLGRKHVWPMFNEAWKDAVGTRQEQFWSLTALDKSSCREGSLSRFFPLYDTDTRPQVLYFTSHGDFTQPRSLPHKDSIHHFFTLWLKCDVVLALLAKYGVKTSNCFRVVALWYLSLFKQTPQIGHPSCPAHTVMTQWVSETPAWQAVLVSQLLTCVFTRISNAWLLPTEAAILRWQSTEGAEWRGEIQGQHMWLLSSQDRPPRSASCLEGRIRRSQERGY